MPSLRSEIIAIYRKQGPGAETCTCGFCAIARREIKKIEASRNKRRAYHAAYYAAHVEQYRESARKRYRANGPSIRKKALAYYYSKKAEQSARAA